MSRRNRVHRVRIAKQDADPGENPGKQKRRIDMRRNGDSAGIRLTASADRVWRDTGVSRHASVHRVTPCEKQGDPGRIPANKNGALLCAVMVTLPGFEPG